MSPCWGPGPSLPELAIECEVKEVLISIPSASGEEMTRILSHCRAAGLRSRTVPSLSEVMPERALQLAIARNRA